MLVFSSRVRTNQALLGRKTPAANDLLPAFGGSLSAVRCLTASRDSFELRAKEEFRKLGEEFTAKADELQRAGYRSRPKAPGGDD
jgi:hypothetical protein